MLSDVDLLFSWLTLADQLEAIQADAACTQHESQVLI